MSVRRKDHIDDSTTYRSVEGMLGQGRGQLHEVRDLVIHTKPNVVKVPRSFEARKLKSSALRRH